MDLFKDGVGMTASDMGAGWCGEALGKKSAAFAFEGGWVDPYMGETFPDVKYDWAQVPTGSSGSPVTISFTVSLLDRRRLEEQGPGLGAPAPYLAGKDGMTTWTEGGVALPSRKDVPTPKGKDVLAASSDFARPGSGFMPGSADVQKAFQDAFTSQIQAKTSTPVRSSRRRTQRSRRRSRSRSAAIAPAPTRSSESPTAASLPIIDHVPPVRRVMAVSLQRAASGGGLASRREAVAGYLFIAIPMILFLVLNIGSILYALYISVWKWNLRTGPVEFIQLKNYRRPVRSDLPDGRHEQPLLRGDLGPVDHGPRAWPWR